MGTRRAENAEQTRRAILEAARRLFTEQGYFATKVGDIAAEARVSVAWVHAAGGGKSGLLRALIENGVDTDDNTEAVAHLATITDPAALVGFLITATRQRFEVWSGLMRQVAAAAPQDDGVRQIQEIAHEGLRGALRVTADRLAEMGALRDGVDARHATDLLWLHLSNTAYFLRTDELGWTLDESEKWLHQAVPAALFTP
ncbi:TetR/AcrR family transcriptional regulator [Actinoplanes rectilineatus]|uniref:TetR/AcrR family transcriptional regulator n=1 Tax=Actinoplanes rectilineatus TaxID=113571 RepID=UPI0005F2A6DA|nr:TetR/AcrR family transcriptional regulator [Actinoplanes rectilineatus]